MALIRVTIISSVLVTALLSSACGDDAEAKKRIEPVYDKSGKLQLLKYDANGDGKVNRFEYYEKDVLVRAEEDSDEDGQIDKWETYEGARLASVAFDSSHRGTPDRRLVYGADGSARLEVDPKGDGHFVAVK